MSKVVLSLLLVALFCSVSQALESPCTFQLKKLNFDLSGLKASKPYQINDYLNESTTRRK